MSTIPTLIRLILRRDRVRLPVWIICIVMFLVMMVPVIQQSLGGTRTLDDLYTQFSANPSIRFLVGPMDSASFGSAFTIKTLLWWGIAVAIMNIFLVVRHTRANEDSGAQEILLSTRVRRGADLVSVLLVAGASNLVIAVGTGVGLSWATSEISCEQGWLFGIGLGLTGCFWAVLGGLIAQLVSSARRAYAVASFVVGAAFVLRGMGDFFGTTTAAGRPQSHWVSFLSPFGWLQATRPLAYPAWWPLSIFVCAIFLALIFAFWLVSIREVGSGFFPERSGRPRATRLGRTAFGLTLVLHRSVWLSWTLGTVALMVVIGAISHSMTSVYSSSEALKRIIESLGGGGALIPAFLSAMLTVAVFMLLAYAIQAMGRLSTEEASGHTVNLLTASVGRWRWYALHVIVVVLGCAIALILCGLDLGISVDVVGGSNHTGEYVVAALSYVPLLLVFISGYALMFGALPRIAGVVVWAYFIFILGCAWFGSLLKFPNWIVDLSLMHYVSAAPAEPIHASPILVFVIIAGTFFVCGGAAWRYRDIQQ